MVMCLNELEKSVLRVMCEREPADHNFLELQLQSVKVQSRENTGAGFFTTLRANPDSPSLVRDKVIGDVIAKVDGLQNPMVFLLFTRNGYVDQLEGAAIEDSTVNVDFSHAKFEILEERVQKRLN